MIADTYHVPVDDAPPDATAALGARLDMLGERLAALDETVSRLAGGGDSSDVVLQHLTAAESRIEGELDAHRHALEAMIGVFGDAVVAKINSVLEGEAATGAPDAAEIVRQELARAVEATEAGVAAGVDQAVAAAERMWADTTRALEAFSTEARRAMEASTLEVSDAAAAAARAALAADQAVLAGRDAGSLLRTELVGLRQAVRAAVEESGAELARAVEAQLGPLTDSGPDVDRLVEELGRRFDRLDEGARSYQEALAEDLRGGLASTAEMAAMDADQRQRDLVSSVREAVGDTERTVARLLLDQLSALDQRQAVLEDGLRAVWTRLDRFEESVDRLASVSGSSTEDLAEVVRAALAGSADEVASTTRDSVTTLVTGMTTAVGELMSGVPAQVSDAVATVPERVVAEVSDAVSGLTTALESAVAAAGDRLAARLGGVLDGLPPQFDQLLARSLADAVADLPERATAELGAHLAAGLAPTIEALPDELTEVVKGLPEYIGAQVAEVIEDLPDRLASSLEGTIAELSQRVVAQVAATVAAVPDGVTAALDAIPDRLAAAVGTAVLEAMDDLPGRLSSGLEALPDRVAVQVASVVGGMPEHLAEILAGAAAEAAESLAASTSALSDELSRTVEVSGEAVAGRLTRSLEVAVGESVTGAVTEAMDDLVRALVVAIDARPVAAAAPGITPDDLASVVEVVRTGIDEAAGLAARSAAEQVRGAGTQAAVEAAAAAGDAAAAAAAEQVTAVMEERRGTDVDAVEDVVHAALGEWADTVAERLAAAGTVVTAIEAAVEAAVSRAIGSEMGSAVEARRTLEPSGGPTPPAPELTAGLVSAVAATLDEFGTRVDHDLDTMADRLERLSDVLEQVVAAVDDVTARRRGTPSDAIVMLRQVAAETSEQIRSDNRQRRSAPGGAFPTPPAPAAEG